MMAFAFEIGDPTAARGVRRIATEQIETALDLAEGSGLPVADRIHELRKTVKKLRGLLRLVAPCLSDWRSDDRILRDAGRALAALRDAAVMQETLAGLLAEGMVPDDRRATLLVPFDAAHAVEDRALTSGLSDFAQALARIRVHVDEWRFSARGFDLMEPGLARTWRDARRALRAVSERPTDNAVHDCRKQVKAHWYQSRLLSPIWPAMMDPHVAAADRLGELLGDCNDLAVLRARLSDSSLPHGDRRDLDARARDRHADLLAEAQLLGRRLFAEKSSCLVARWRNWWEIWRA